MSSMLQLKKNLSQYDPPHNKNVSRCASVLIPLMERDGELYMLLTQRSDQLNSHSGQVAFPGGKQDSDDQDELHTALRETEEEIGLLPENVEILGQIDQILSKGKLLVTPFVGLIPSDFKAQPNMHEIQEVFEVPFAFFMNDDNHVGKLVEWPQSAKLSHHLSHHFYFCDYDIWGMTAMLILRLLEVGLGYQPSYDVHVPASPTWMDFSQRYKEDS